MSKKWISRDDIFAALEMRQVLEHYGIKSGRGSSFRIHCPFHEDDRPSCSINPKDKVYNCFGCNSQGNVLDFIAEMEGLDPSAEFRAVLETAVEIMGHNPSQKRKKSAKAKSTSSSDLKTKEEEVDEVSASENSTTETLEPNRVLEGPAFPLKLDPGHAYLKQRGISKSLATKFGIGFETRSSALMAGRICFPIHNLKGELVAYSGRWTDDEDFVDGKEREQERYKFPTGFKKQLELYNLHYVLEQFPDTSTIVLVEGFWSVLRLSSLTRSKQPNSGIPCVAMMGLSLSEQQMELLKGNGFNNIILMLDGDEEGRSATKRLLRQMSPSFFVKDAHLPDGAKPDDVEEVFLNRFVKDHFPTLARQAEPKIKKPTAKASATKTKPRKSGAKQSVSVPPKDYSIGTSWSQLV